MICYQIQPISPEAHIFGVRLNIASPCPEGQVVALPAWIPGSYMIRDFAKNIVTLKATCKGKELDVKKLDKQTWQCSPCEGELVVDYQVYAWDLSVRGAHLDTTHAYFNGTSLFLRPVGQEEGAIQVEIQPPEGERYRNWRVATALSTSRASLFGFGLYRARSYAELIDHPVEMGAFTLVTFDVAGVPHHVVITGRHQADVTRLCRDLKAICEQHITFFGELPAMEHYLFLVMAVGEGYGGLEHNNSCSLICSRDDLPTVTDTHLTAGYRRFLGLCSHEYFHLWNVKRIVPERLLRSDLSQEAHTELLWAFEGITSYYDDLSLLRCGILDAAGYLELLAETITRVMQGSGRKKQSVAESSFDAWTKFYKQDENSANAIVSYYAKGALVALGLDLTIRTATKGEKSLDDLMRALWEHHGKVGVGVQEAGVETLAEKVTGLDLKAFFQTYLRGTGELPIEEWLDSVGVGFRLRPAKGEGDRGGIRPKGRKDERPRPVLGARIARNGSEPRLAVVSDEGAAKQAGLAAGDVIVAVDGIRSTPGNLEAQVGRVPAGETVPVHAFRRDELMEFQLTPRAAPADTCELWLQEEITADQQQNREKWFPLVV